MPRLFCVGWLLWNIGKLVSGDVIGREPRLCSRPHPAPESVRASILGIRALAKKAYTCGHMHMRLFL